MVCSKVHSLAVTEKKKEKGKEKKLKMKNENVYIFRVMLEGLVNKWLIYVHGRLWFVCLFVCLFVVFHLTSPGVREAKGVPARSPLEMFSYSCQAWKDFIVIGGEWIVNSSHLQFINTEISMLFLVTVLLLSLAVKLEGSGHRPDVTLAAGAQLTQSAYVTT